MKSISLFCTLFFAVTAFSQVDTTIRNPSLVDFDAYEKLVSEVKTHRASRLLSIEEFNDLAKDEKVIILDARSKEMFDAKHIKGAINLSFSDFTQGNLARIIPSTEYKVLIYCNNNIGDDEDFFPTKSMKPLKSFPKTKELTLALNIPTYINLYGYGYREVYELGELISVFDERIQFEGTAVVTE